ncbi:MAG: M48 family metalloprotease, partial [Proteobacteria bacterium]|nr:M48 family metalloprotease [Pseudomonadota bacterium]
YKVELLDNYLYRIEVVIMLKNKLLSTTVIIFFVLFMVALLIHWLLWSGDYISISPTEWHFAWLFFVIGSGILFWAIGISIWKDYKNNIKNHALYDQAHWFFVMVLSSWERVIIYSGLLFVIPIIYIGACSGLFSNHLWQSKGLVEFFSEIPYSWEDSVNAMITYTKITLFFYIFIFLYLIWVAGDIFGGVGGTATGNRNFYDEQRRNLIRSWVLFAINAIIFAFVGVAMGLLIHLWIKPLKFPYILWTPAMWEWSIIVIVTSILLVIWLIFYLVFYYQGLKYVSKAFGAREPTDEEKHRYGNIFKNMHISAGLIGEHSWKICDNEEPNAAAAGRNSTDSCIFVNTGLLRLLDDDELQAVIAHEVAHIFYIFFAKYSNYLHCI